MILQTFLQVNNIACAIYRKISLNTRYTHSVNASCSNKVQEDIICIHMKNLLEDVALL